jgi:hypothetical protein
MAEDIDSIGALGAVGASDLSPTRDAVNAPRATRPVDPSSAVGSGQKPPQPPSAQSVEDALKRANARLAETGRMLELHVDAATGLTIATLKNAATGEVLEQTPGIDLVHLVQMLTAWAHGRGVLLNLIA